MVTTGFSRIHVAKYSETGGTVAYSQGRELARARSMETSIETTEDNAFYANNQVAELEPAQFASGSANIVVDGLDPDEEAFIMGITPSGEAGQEVIEYGEGLNPPYVGIGAIKRQQMKGVVTYRPIIFTKARFSIPSESAATQEENISWQEQTLVASLMRDDTAKRNWKLMPKTNLATEDEAVAWIRTKLNIAEESA